MHGSGDGAGGGTLGENMITVTIQCVAARAVKGAVDDFFSGTAYAAPDLQKCPRQVVVTYRERGWNSWMVAK